MTKQRLVLAALLLGVALVVGCGRSDRAPTPIRPTPQPSATPLSLPRFESGNCQTFISTPYEHECGLLTVLEDRDQPAGRQVRLPVVIFKSSSDQPAPDPLIYLPEGGGYSQIHHYDRILDTVGQAVLETRDLIIFNQRGSELSMPHFFCPGYYEFLREVRGSNLDQLELNIAEMVFWHSCYDRLMERDLDLSMYNSAANAADANDLRLALGYDQANFYAKSYGSRIGLSLIRDFPEGVRSLVLDSAYPPQVDYYSEHAGNANRAFSELFETCAQDPYCSEHYPDLEGAFFQAVDDLNVNPIRLHFYYLQQPILVDGDMFMEAIYTSLSSAEAIQRVPQMVYDASHGDLVALEASILETLNVPHTNLALFFSAQCHEEAPFDSYEDVLARIADLPPQVAALFGESFSDFQFDICEFWKTRPPDPRDDEAVVSAIPTLILAGQFDPLSPPEWGRQAAATLENSYFYEIPNEGHGVVDSNDCALALTLSFLDEPGREPDASCLAEPAALDFEVHLPVPRFEPSGCYFNYSSNTHKAECGYLIVPEDRSQPDSPTIKLHVAIFKSTSTHPAPDPVIYVAGGGGTNHLDSYDSYLENGGYEILRDRDYIMYNQRGTRYNHPELACPGYSAFLRRLARQNLSTEEQDAQHAAFLLECYQNLRDQGIDLEYYTTAANAADLNDLRIALGYDQVNLYGTSYGPHIILEVLRDYPEGVRSAIIDSVYPPQASIYVELPHNALRAFNVVFEDCAADPDCNTKYPNLEATFYGIVDELNADPFFLGTMWIDGRDLMDAVFSALYHADAIPYIPQWIDQVSHGDHSGLRWFYETGTRGDNFEKYVAHGVHHSILCHEALFNDPAEAAALADRLPPQIQECMGWPPWDYTLCESWDAGAADSRQHEPVFSDVPTLIFAGRYDPITPPAWGRLAAETLSRSYFYEFPMLGHGVMRVDPCALDIGLQFLDDPTSEPDASCMETLTPPEFE